MLDIIVNALNVLLAAGLEALQFPVTVVGQLSSALF